MKILFLMAFSFLSFSIVQDKIHWKKLDTEEKVRMEMDKKIFPGSDFDADYKILAAEKHEWLSAQGDTTILFHSPFIPVHVFSLVSRKWMFTFHFKEKKLVNYSVERGLLGP